MTLSRKFTTALLALALLAGVGAHAQDDAAGDAASSDAVVLRVGETEVTAEEFDARFEIALRGLAAQQGMQITPELRAQLAPLAPQFLQQRAGEVALLEAARERGIEVPQEEIDARFEEARAGVPDDAAFQNLLEVSGIGSEEMLRTLLREDALIGQLQADIEAEQQVDDAAVRAAYDEDPSQFEVGEQVCASHILVETEEEAQTALEEIESGTPFADVAAERGTDGTASRGGELGCFGRGQMVPPFEEAVFDPEAPLNEPFGPVQTDFGHHVVMVTERQEAETLPFEEVQEDLRAQLVEEAVQNELVALIEEAGVETFPERLPQPEVPAQPTVPAPDAPATPDAPAEEAPATPATPEAPAEDAPAAPATPEAPAEEAPVDEAPAEEAPESEEAPAEDAAPEGEAAD